MSTSRPLAVAPATSGISAPQSSLTTNSCQPCARRKVKCDRVAPTCAGCARRKEDCVYQAPPPRRPRKRTRLSLEDMHERLARYERTLREHGLLSASELNTPDSSPACKEETPGTSTSAKETRTGAAVEHGVNAGLTGTGTGASEAKRSYIYRQPDVEPATVGGKLLASAGKSRYIDNNLWFNIGDEEMQAMMDAENSGDNDNEAGNDNNTDHPSSGLGGLAGTGGYGDPLSQALLGLTQNLASHHPAAETALKLWQAYAESVEPLCRILHVPTTARMVAALVQRPHTASKAQECLLFSVYYVAVHATPAEDCVRLFGEAKGTLLPRFQFAVSQALVNASWLRTMEMPVLQAYVLFLIATRSLIDPNTYWVLVGVAMRISMRMGLHRDGTNLGLPPFEVQMRRRLFWQLFPLDGYAGQMAGTGVFVPPSAWDTKPPLNCDDSDMWPGMTRMPEEKRGASDMIFVLPRVELSIFYLRTAVRGNDVGPQIEVRKGEEIERLIDGVEEKIEANYLRYCDVVDPLHFLTLAISRSAINTVRLRNRLSGILNNSITDSMRRDLCALSLKVLDTNCTIHATPSLQKFRWQIRSFSRDAMLCVLGSLGKVGFFGNTERDAIWTKIEQVYAYHAEPPHGQSALYLFVGRVTLQVWRANPPTNAMPEPSFITALRTLPQNRKSSIDARASMRRVSDSSYGTVTRAPDTGATFSLDGIFDTFDSQELSFEAALNSVPMDWRFWDEGIFGHTSGSNE
ncbi:mitogen-activated protein kinase [Xylariaceae sp. FL1651]|nr:mitogen-activated protein kinase [Xylariaceae sp. FL1651]